MFDTPVWMVNEGLTKNVYHAAYGGGMFRYVPLLLLFVFAQVSLAKVIPPTDGGYTDPKSGFTFPEKISAFNRFEGTDFADKTPRLGVGFSYRNERGTTASLFVYDFGLDGDKAGYVEQQRSLWMGLDKEAVKKGEYTDLKVKNVDACVYFEAECRSTHYSYKIPLSDIPIDCIFVVLGKGEYFYKLEVRYPTGTLTTLDIIALLTHTNALIEKLPEDIDGLTAHGHKMFAREDYGAAAGAYFLAMETFAGKDDDLLEEEKRTFTYLAWRLGLSYYLSEMEGMASAIWSYLQEEKEDYQSGQVSWVNNDSMSPTLLRGDYVALDSEYPGSARVKRGDVVFYRVFSAGKNAVQIGRVAGVPGDTIKAYSRPVFISDQELTASFDAISDGEKISDSGKRTIGDSQYFILGDNAESSVDSRFLGAIPQERIIGRALVVMRSYEGDFQKEENPRQDRFGLHIR